MIQTSEGAPGSRKNSRIPSMLPDHLTLSGISGRETTGPADCPQGGLSTAGAPAWRWGHRRGFALVVTLILMVLLTVIAVGLLSLSSIALRSTARGEAMAKARCNARIAALLGVGELQRQLGPDQRISAPAAVLDSSGKSPNPEWVGVWDSNTSGNASYTTGRPAAFRRWLVSGSGGETLDSAKAPLVDGVTMMSARGGRLPVVVEPQEIHGQGGFAWWVSDDSMKARVDLPLDPSVPDDASLIGRRYGARRYAPEVIAGMNGFDAADAGRMITAGTAGISLAHQDPATRPPLPLILSSNSMSLPVDVVKGGFKRDINSLFELPESQIDKREYGTWSGSAAQSSQAAHLYGAPKVTLGARWNHLFSYYNLYKKTLFSRGVPVLKPEGALIDWRLADQYKDFGDSAGGFRFPRIAKIIYVFSYSSDRVTSGPSAGKYKLKLVTDAFITVWNPYNARIEFPANTSMYIKLSKDLPMSFEWLADKQVKGNARLGQMFASGSFSLCESPMKTARSGVDLFQMEPGETLLFTMSDAQAPSNVAKDASNESFYPGVGYKGGFSTTQVLGSGNELIGEGGTRISVSLKPRNDAAALVIGGVPTSQYVDFWIYDNSKRRPYYEHRGEIVARADTPFIGRIPEIKSTEVRSVSLMEVAGRKQPFGAFIMEMKTARDSKVPSLAFLQSGISRLSSRIDGSKSSEALERLEYRLEAVTGWDSDIIQTTVGSNPSGANHGFIGSGRTFATGQTHVADSEIPFLPVLSLSQFRHAGVGDGSSVLRATHWGFNSTPLPPYVDHAVGNSYAHPLIPATSSRQGDLYDQSYNANQALWDHYFCSSLAPQTVSLFDKQRPINQVWRDFVEDGQPMLNPRHVLWEGGISKRDILASVLKNGGASLRDDAYLRIASHLMIQGGFNVNSTSVEAWQAFLSSCRHESLRTFDPITRRVGNEVAKGTPFARSAIPLGSAIDDMPGDISLHYLGFRDLDDGQIKTLAERIVEQVLKRGPFQSLAEFTNRQLSRDSDLSLRGALQAAIDSTDINQPIAAGGVAVAADPAMRFAFPEAARGNSAEGAPGWLTQADLLDTMGPLVTVRGDTFTVRGYGESRSKNGTVEARAWCEMIVQRIPEYLNPADNLLTLPQSPVNERFGRRMQILSFRWIPDHEI